MAIDMSRYVKITSGVGGAPIVTERPLVGRVFSESARVPVGSILEFRELGQVVDYFGAGSAEASFAKTYFSYISPPPARRAPLLQFSAFVSGSRPAALYGSKPAALGHLKTFANTDLEGSIAGTAFAATGIDLSTATDMDDVASRIQTALNAELSGAGITTAVTFNSLRNSFELQTNTTGDAEIELGANQLWLELGLSTGINSPGADTQTPLESFRASVEIDDGFGSAAFIQDSYIDDAGRVELSEVIEQLGVDYQIWWTADSPSAAIVGLVEDIAMTGVVFGGHNVAALPLAIQAAIDYGRANAATSYMFKRANIDGLTEVTDDATADTLDAGRVNYYGTTSSAGRSISFFQRGVLMGGPEAPTDAGVASNEQWLKRAMQAKVMDLLLSSSMIPANRDGELMLRGVAQGVIDRALSNGTIQPGKTLTPAQQAAITASTGDGDAWRDVQAVGSWLGVKIVEQVGAGGQPEHIMKYDLIYAKGDSIRFVDGTHNLI